MLHAQKWYPASHLWLDSFYVNNLPQNQSFLQKKSSTGAEGIKNIH